MIQENKTVKIYLYCREAYPGIPSFCRRMKQHGIFVLLPDAKVPALSMPEEIQACLLTMQQDLAREAYPLLITDSLRLAGEARKLGFPLVGLSRPEHLNDCSLCCDLLTDSFRTLNHFTIYGLAAHKYGFPAIIGHTRRLYLREFTSEDARWLPTVYTGNVAEYMDTLAAVNLDTAEKLDAYQKEIYPFYGCGLYGVFSLEDNPQPLGGMGFYNEPLCNPNILSNDFASPSDETFLSYFLSEAAQGQGYAQEGLEFLCAFAFGELKKERLYALIDVRNLASRRLIQKLFFCLCPEKLQRRGRVCCLYVLTREHYFLRRAKAKVQTAYQQAPEDIVYSRRYCKRIP